MADEPIQATPTTQPQTAPAVIYLQFFARRERDNSYTLCLDSTAADVPPLEIGGGFDSVDAVIEAVNQALTAPAVAEDRVAVLEEYIPAVSQTIDAVNEANAGLITLNDRIRELEEWAKSLQDREEAYRVPARPPIPRVPQPRQTTGPAPGLRRPVAGQGQPEPEQDRTEKPLPQRKTVVFDSPLDSPRPDFDRGDFRPHQPVPRVGRLGPNSVDRG